MGESVSSIDGESKNEQALGKQSQARTLCVWKVTGENVPSSETVCPQPD